MLLCNCYKEVENDMKAMLNFMRQNEYGFLVVIQLVFPVDEGALRCIMV